MGVYSPNMLSHFPEQFRQFTYFNQIPGINSGYTIDPDFAPRTLWGVLQTSLIVTRESNGNLANTSNEYLWTDQKLTMGYFVQFNDVVFRVLNENDWMNEGGLVAYSIQRLIGGNGSTMTQTWENGASQI